METMIVGGNFGNPPKESGIVGKLTEGVLRLADESDVTVIFNGGTLEQLPHNIDSDLIIWMPNISNETEKNYPVKKKGAVLICSKVMREGYRRQDAVARIFKMHGNAVIAIYDLPDGRKSFKLIDALNNIHWEGDDIEGLAHAIKEFYKWTKSAVRIGTIRDDSPVVKHTVFRPDGAFELLELNDKLAKFIQTSCDDRFFGNLSTRCQKLFPSEKDFPGIYVSPRNCDKEKLCVYDMVYVTPDMRYSGDNKPSVDTPVQMRIYQVNPDVRYMIHGHAFITREDVPETSRYYLCGDVREADDVLYNIMDTDVRKYGAINLKNHGFLLYSDTLENMEKLIDDLISDPKNFTYERD